MRFQQKTNGKQTVIPKALQLLRSASFDTSSEKERARWGASGWALEMEATLQPQEARVLIDVYLASGGFEDWLVAQALDGAFSAISKSFFSIKGRLLLQCILRSTRSAHFLTAPDSKLAVFRTVAQNFGEYCFPFFCLSYFSF